MLNLDKHAPEFSFRLGVCNRAAVVFIVFTVFFTGMAAAQPTEILGPGLDSGRTDYFQTVNRVLSSDTTYILTGLYYVDSLFTLTIPSGTIIKCDTAATLIIRRGAQIFATGEACSPIVFTSNEDPGSRQPGDWAGIVILGEAPVNKTEPTIPGGLSYGTFGGNDSNDDSGTFEYVRIEYPGYRYAPNDNINGLMLGGVGRGTTISNVQISYSDTDAFAFYGGTVDASYFISLACTRNDMLTNLGYRGNIQFFFGLRDESLSDPTLASIGLASQNDGSATSTDTPYTKPIISNATIVGPERTNAMVPVSPLETFSFSAVLRHSSQLCLYNSVLMGWPHGLSIQDLTTQQFAELDSLQWRNVSVQATLEVIPASGSVHDEQNWDLVTSWFDTTGWDNIGSSPRNPDDLLLGDLTDLTEPDAVPQPGSELIGSASFTNPHLSAFVVTTYQGAFDPSLDMSEQWTQGWSNFDPQITDYVDTINVPSVDYPDIQSGLDAAANGATVLVASGVYTGANNRNLDPGGKNIELRSQSGALVTIIDCQHSGAGFIINNGSPCTPIIDGFTMTNGDPLLSGVAVRVGPITSLATFRNCLITGNKSTAATGSVVRVQAGSPTFEYCIVTIDTATTNSGIVSVTGGDPYFYQCTVTSNIADECVRLNGGTPQLQDCTIDSNDAAVAVVVKSAATIAGGQINGNSNVGLRFIWASGSPVALVDSITVSGNGDAGISVRRNSSLLRRCVITENTGGGIVFDPGPGAVHMVVSPTFEDCSIKGNTGPPPVGGPAAIETLSPESASNGSGIRFDCPIVDASGVLEPLFDNCTVTGNASSGDGGGIYICGQAWAGGVIAPVFTSCTISANAAGNQGGGIYMDVLESSGGEGTATFDLSILYSNCAYGSGDSGDEAWVSNENEISFWCCDVNTNGMIGTAISTTDVTVGNPAFCEMAFCDIGGTLAGDFTLVVNSHSAENSSPCELLIGAHPVACSEPLVGINDPPALPVVTALYQNEPNPFNPFTSIRFDLAKRGAVDLRIYDVKGRLIRVLVDRVLPRERHSVQWDGTNNRGNAVASGIYFVRLSTPQVLLTRKMLLLK